MRSEPRSGALIFRRSAFTAGAVVAAFAAFGCAGSEARSSGVLTQPIDPRQQTLVTFGRHSHWLQPWRGYLDTVPATRLLGAIGINFNVTAAEAPAAAALLAASGFRRARVEINWGDLDYADPTKLAKLADVRAKLLALKSNGIRPLILLNANDGHPCPSKALTLKIAENAKKGDRQLVLDSASAAAVVPGKTGLNISRKRGGKRAANILFTSVAADGTAQLSQPLPADVDRGSYQGATLAYQPFAAPFGKDGTPNPAFEETLGGWLAYAGTVTRTVKDILGSESFDVEIWNELTFGSAFLSIAKYYDPAPKGRGDVTKELLERTVAYLRDPKNGVAGVGIGDGFANTRPWDAGSTSPVGLTAIDKHPYPTKHHYPPDDGKGKSLNALGQIDDSGFVPTYTAFFPEYYLAALQTETLVRDLSPITTQVAGAAHGRLTAPAGAKPPEVWITEVNMSPRAEDKTISEPAFEHVQAKIELRTLVSYVNKGVTALHFFAAKGDAFGLIHAGADGGPTLASIRRLRAAFGHVAALTQTQPLSLISVADKLDHVQFKGDGTAAHPPLYDRDVVAFLPFQATPTRYVVPVYVMTRNVTQVYKPAAPASDVTRYDLPPETFQLTIGGLAGKWRLGLFDPLTNTKAPVTVLLHVGSRLVVSVPLTDSPRLLTISRS